MFKVQRKACATCIYRKDSTLDIRKLEADVADGYGGFKGHRICHHAPRGSNVCCRGFWNRHKDQFAAGQIAQRLGLVQFVAVDTLRARKRDTTAVHRVRPKPRDAGVAHIVPRKARVPRRASDE